MCDKKLVEDISSILKEILAENHTEYEKKKLDDFKDMQLTMACPVCGDSHKDEHKKRGILFLDSMKYYCFNGDCNAKYWSIFTFFKYFGKKIRNLDHIKTISDAIQKSSQMRKPTKLIESSEYFEFMYKNSISMSKIKGFYALMTANDCDWGQQFINDRMLHNFKDRIMFRKNNYGNREVWVLNKINENDMLIGAQIKNLDFTAGAKYTTKTFNTLHEEMYTQLVIPDDYKEKCQMFSTIFNIFNVDLDRDVTVFEGPIDSFFIGNSIATAGASKLKNFFDGLDNFKYFYDNDTTGKKSAIEKIKKDQSCFLWQRFFKVNKFKYKKIKDLNDLIIYVYNNKEYRKSLKQLKDTFSKNKYDIYHV